MWKYDIPVSIAIVLWKHFAQFVKNKVIQDGWSGFLQHVGSLTRSEKLYTLQKWFTQFSYGWELKSPRNKILSEWYNCQDLCSSGLCDLIYFFYGDYTNNTKAMLILVKGIQRYLAIYDLLANERICHL